MNPEPALRFMLRFFGTMSLLAIPFIFVPYSVMDDIHQQLQLGKLPDEPIVGYLARSLSAFYALVGALFWKISFDLRRYRSLLIYLCGALTLLGGTLCFIDWWEGLPTVWKLWEGPQNDLDGIAFREIHMLGWNLADQSLVGAALHDNVLDHADLRCANLSDASFVRTSVQNANFTDATITGSRFRQTLGLTLDQISVTANYRSGDLSGIDFVDLDLSQWKFQSLQILNTSFASSDLTQALPEGEVTALLSLVQCPSTTHAF